MTQPSMDARHIPSLLHVGVRFLLYGAVGLILLSWNPFGLNDATLQASQDALYRVFATQYPRGAEQHITVVLLDDDAIGRLAADGRFRANEWPIAYMDHELVMRRILQFAPRAVFVDILFENERDSDGTLDRALGRLAMQVEDSPVPLIFATGDRPSAMQQRIVSELKPAASLAKVTWSGHRLAYPLTFGSHGARVDSAALALYRARGNDASWQVDGEAPPPPLSLERVGANDAISVRWSGMPGPSAFSGAAPACDAQGGWVRRLWRDVSNGLIHWDDADRLVKCPPHTVVAVDDLVRTAENPTAAERERLTELFSGRLVLYGVHIPGSGDYRETPVHGQLPGVFTHAMALDNLLTYGDRVAFAANERYSGVSQLAWLVMAFVLASIRTFQEWIAARKAEGCGARFVRAWFGSSVWWFVVVSGAIAWVSWSLYADLHYEPLNSIDFLALTGAILSLSKSPWSARTCRLVLAPRVCLGGWWAGVTGVLRQWCANIVECKEKLRRRRRV